jgi:hypothetical protein
MATPSPLSSSPWTVFFRQRLEIAEALDRKEAQAECPPDVPPPLLFEDEEALLRRRDALKDSLGEEYADRCALLGQEGEERQ